MTVSPPSVAVVRVFITVTQYDITLVYMCMLVYTLLLFGANNRRIVVCLQWHI